MPNRLAHETSPYLLQHANNPVDWFPWGPEALARAKAENRPILLSIGYSACHWCHVMERESFEDQIIAETMNRDFVCIKVDREERPDLDEIYMKATLAMNHGQGGWPMTVFLTPDQRPFFAGTYFPPRDAHGRPGFPTLLRHIQSLWTEKREAVIDQAARITDHIDAEAKASAPEAVGAEELRLAGRDFRRDFDPIHGGFGRAPKFPPATGLSLLLRVWRRFSDGDALHMVNKTLDAMARGGMYDQIGGGFSRYSTDERWLVPHFEKMLYDNALLARVYLESSQATGDAFHRRIAVEILDYVLREMVGREGGFHSATDADSEGVEGKFFVWQPSEVKAILGDEEGRRLCAWFDLTAEGNWEGHSIPNTPRSEAAVASELGIAVDELGRSVAAGRAKLYAARAKRIPPGRDDKVLTAWNGMMIGALAEGARIVGEPGYLTAAVTAADFLLTTLRRPDGGLFRTYRAGKAHLDAYLEDYAWLASALIDLYEAGAGTRFLDEAATLAQRMLADFSDEKSGALFNTAHEHERLIVRHREAMDGATPSGNAVAAEALARLSFHLDRSDLREAASRAVSAYGRIIARYPRAFAKSLAVVDLLLDGPIELALVGARDDARTIALERAVAGIYLPCRIIAHADPSESPSPTLPLLAQKGLLDGKPALYICRDFACQVPVTSPEEATVALAALAPARDLVVPPSKVVLTATAEATREHTARFAPHGVALLGATGLTVSRIGFGGYRVDDSDPDFAEALRRALVGGINLVDTSTNYTDGGSERMVGAVLAELERESDVKREAIVVVSKIGYVQGQNLRLAHQRESKGHPFAEMVKYVDGCWHCIHPDFLRDQLGRSLARLGLRALDVCLLHNPEYFFSDAVHRADPRPIEALREEFYRRLQAAFAYFEQEVIAGRLACYGVSSNSVARPESDPEATSLSRMLDAARAAGGEHHHFRVLQLPMNLLESGGVLAHGSDGKTVLDLASERGVGVLINRPLNAIRGKGMVRFADPMEGSEGMDPERQARTAKWARDAIDPSLPEERQREPLQRKTLWTLASTPGVDCVLLGMRRPRYVDDALAVLSWPRLAEASAVYSAFQG